MSQIQGCFKKRASAGRALWQTLSLLVLNYAGQQANMREAASVISIFIVLLTVGVAVALRAFGSRLGVRHDRVQVATAPGRQLTSEQSRAGVAR
jgi:hypothetical protein